MAIVVEYPEQAESKVSLPSLVHMSKTQITWRNILQHFNAFPLGNPDGRINVSIL